MFDILGALVSGGATGIIGAVVNRVFDYKTEKLRIHQKIMDNKHDLAMLELETTGKLRIAETEAEGELAVAREEAGAKIAEAQHKALSASLEADGRKYSSNGDSFLFVLIDVLRGLIRPAATIYYSVIMTLVAMKLYQLLDSTGINLLMGEDIFALLKEVILLLIYMTSTVTLWWFGTRGKAPSVS